MSFRFRGELAVLLLVVAGCAEPVDSEPTYFGDVQPLLRARCVRCHGADPLVAGVADFRLDRFVPDDDTTLDLWDMRARVIEVAVDGDEPAMPADFPLGDRQKDTLERWVAAGAPRGERDNHPPQLERLAALPDRSDQSVALQYRATDADDDGLVITVVATGSSEHILATGLGGALRTAVIDTSSLGDGDYQLELRADDGYSPEPGHIAATLSLGSLAIDHGERGATPTVTVVEPSSPRLHGMEEVSWIAADADAGDTLTAHVEVFRILGNGTQQSELVLADAIAADASPLTLDTSLLDAGPGDAPYYYQVTVTITDAADNRRSASSPRFRL